MPSFTLTKRALIDLVEIGTYTQKHWGWEQRNNYLTMLDGCIHQFSAGAASCYPLKKPCYVLRKS